MPSLWINVVHALCIAFGMGLIHWLARGPQTRRWTLPFAWLWGLTAAAYGFRYAQPPDPYVFNDFRSSYWLAGQALWQGPEALASTYAPEHRIFVNLPIVAYLFAPLGLLPQWTAATVWFVAGLLIVGLAHRQLVALYGLDRRESAFVLLGLIASGPMIFTFREGNTSQHVLTLLLGGLLCVRRGREATAGVLYAFAALIKPALLLVGLLQLARGRFRIAAAGAATLVAAVSLSLAIFGWHMHELWYEATIVPNKVGPVSAFIVQNVQAFALRFQVGMPGYTGYEWSPRALSDTGRIVALGLTSGLLIACAIAVRTSRRIVKLAPGDLELETLLAILFAMIAGPLSWSHYYVWAAPAFALLLAQARTLEHAGRARGALAALFGLFVPVIFLSSQVANGRFGRLSNFVVSHLLLGATCLFCLLVYLRARRTPLELVRHDGSATGLTPQATSVVGPTQAPPAQADFESAR